MRRMRTVLLICLLAALPAAAQETRGNISGTVEDADGVIPGATVKITSVDTNVAQVLVTNNTGYFEAPLLQPGRYSIAVEMQGFRPIVREGVVLAVGQQINIPFRLEVGNLTDEVTVTAESPVIDTTSVSSGVNFDSKLVENLPMFSNMPVGLARYAPGVTPDDEQPHMSQGFVTGPSEAAGRSVGQVGSNTYTIDGATNAGVNRQLASSPNADMIQEMRVETSNFDAAVGHGLGNQISMMTRAGTNALRGTVNYQYWTNKLNALNAQQKRTFNDEARAVFDQGRSHNSAFTLGGPLRIPRLLDGRDKAFFFVNYSYVNDSIPGRNQGTITVPANARHLQGDFSDMLQLPNPNQYRIYDPLTARPDPNNPNRVIRDPFPNNVIPRDRIFNPDGTYKNPLFGIYAGAVPEPNQNFLSPTQQPTGNFFRGGEPSVPVSHLYGVRIDYNISASNRLFVRGSGSRYHEDTDDWSYEAQAAQWRGLHNSDRVRSTWSYTGTWTHVIGAAAVVDTQVSANRFYTIDEQRQLTQYKPSDFGMPAYLDDFCAERSACLIPRVNISGYQPLSRGSNPNADTTTNIQGQVNVTKIRASHTWRSGFDVRRAMRGGLPGGNSSGVLNFTRDYTRQASDETQLTANNLGLSLAAFMLGVPTSVQVDSRSPGDFYNHFLAAYGQDSWRVSSNLTVNAGLRFEYENGIREEQDRMLVGFNSDAQLAITEAAQAAYLASGVANTAGMRPSISVLGGAIFATDAGQDGSTWKGQAMWMPRLSAAYRLGTRTVVKGAWGLFYDSLSAGDESPSQTGYDVTTTSDFSDDLGRTFRYTLADPFPVRADGTRFDTALGSSLGYNSLLGTGFTAQNLSREHSRQQRWRVSIQRELARNLGVEIAYNGSFSDRIGRTIRQDYLPEEFWNGSNERNTAAQAFLNANVTNPFRLANFAFLQTSDPVLYQRMASSSFFTSATIQRNRLLRDYPHMTNVSYANLPVGEVKVHTLEVTVNRRFADGLSGVASFSANSVRENRTVEEYDRAPTLWQGSNGGRPYRITASAVYELPFGTGRAFLNQRGILAEIVGGWQIAGSYDYQPGALLDWGNLFFYGDLKDIVVDNPTNDRWFNTDAGFEKDPARTPANFQKRAFPFRVDGVRGQALSMLSGSLTRSVDLGNRRTVQLRVDAQNLLNRQHWRNANTNPTSTDFGKVTAVTTNFMRFITFGIRLSY